MVVKICVFDAYGTLFDVNAAARQAASEPEREALAARWPALANDWRLKQLQYTWLRTITGSHADFWKITEDSLDWALEATGLDGDANLRRRLLDLYHGLGAFPEVYETLVRLRQYELQTAVLSNGSPGMLRGAVESAGIGGMLDEVLSVESVGVFKPDPRVYDLVQDRFDCARNEVLFASSNGWDAASAAGYGFVSVWVNRADEPMDRLPWHPAKIVPNLSSIPDLVCA